MTNKQELITINVNGQEIEVPKGVLLVEATKVADVEIPVFCYHPKLEPVGMCRMCLVEVGSDRDRGGNVVLDEEGNPRVSWFPKLMPACTTPVSPGMYVNTTKTQVADAWRGTLEFLLTSHPLDCPVCDKGGECPLQDLTFAYGPDLSRFYKRNKFHFEKPIPLGELIWLDRERCIYCSRCVRFQEDVAGDPVLKFADRNRGQEIVTYSDPPFNSYFSGNTSDICPVGALTTEDFRFKARVWELVNVPSIDIYDCVGSNIVLGTRSNEIKRIMPRANEWVNEIWLSDKTRFGHHFVGSPERLQTPLIKENGQFREATWQEALTVVADRLVAVSAQYGSHTIGGIAGDRAGNEDLYLFAKLMRFIGTNHIDFRMHWPTNSGIEEALSNVGLTSGSNLGQLSSNAAVFTFGADLEEEQPTLYLRMRRAVKQGTKLMVVQSRSTKEMNDATQALLIKPAGYAHLAVGLLKHLLKIDKPHFGKRQAGVKELQAGVNKLGLEQLAAETGLEVRTIEQFAETIAESEQVIFMVGREALQASGANAATFVDALSAILVATGKAGQANCGLLALWPHNNSQGAADMGVLPHFEAGYKPIKVPGATIAQMLNGEAGLRAAYVLASNPLQERPACADLINTLDFLVVQELFMTETAELADVVLPAAAFAERDGTFTNFERRVQRYQKALEPVGQALPDWQIIVRLAALLDAKWPDYFTTHDIATEMAKKVKPYKGFTYEKLRGESVAWTTTADGHHIYTGTSLLNTWYGLQWSVEAESRRPQFDLNWHDLQPVPSLSSGEFRLIMQRKQYDNGTMIRHSRLLDGRGAKPFVKLSPQDAESLKMSPGDMVRISANGSQVIAPLVIDSRLQPSTVVLSQNVGGIVLDIYGESYMTVTVQKASPTYV